jgi:hypothetical protein
MQPIMPRSRRERERAGKTRPGGGPLFVGLVVVFLLIIVLAVIGIASGGSSTKHNASVPSPAPTTHHPHHHRAAGPTTTPRSGVVELKLKATAPVWVCLQARGNRTLINGVILTPSSAQQTYRSSRFAMTLGNSSVALTLDGQRLNIPASSQPISFSLTASGKHPLSGGALPHCA